MVRTTSPRCDADVSAIGNDLAAIAKYINLMSVLRYLITGMCMLAFVNAGVAKPVVSQMLSIVSAGQTSAIADALTVIDKAETKRCHTCKADFTGTSKCGTECFFSDTVIGNDDTLGEVILWRQADRRLQALNPTFPTGPPKVA